MASEPSKELVTRRVTMPATGEVLDLDAADVLLAAALDEAKDIEGRIRSYKRAIVDEVLDRQDRRAKWTTHAAGWKLTGESPDRFDFDADKLVAVLRQLIKEGLIDREAADACVKVETVVTPRKGAVKALAKRGGRVVELLDVAKVPVEKPRNVWVRRQS